MATAVDFYFGIGSRYSYLASSQLDRVTEITGAQFIWKPVYSPELIARAGPNPFTDTALRGQYDPAYRARDVGLWARHYGIPFNDPGLADDAWKRLAMACIAAELLGDVEPLARRLWQLCFGEGQPLASVEDVVAQAAHVGFDEVAFSHTLASGRCEAAHEQRIAEAVALGVFGVPTFLVADELFWGQDRLPLLVDLLTGRR